ncbi:hypothetical protein BTM25_04000 [Actinomadura rubteroloni]|uniref:Uncharacterized protein n=1 Tax=Actinomadura rubteroloni TaxID=1926885 RepID=A0A2P4ULU0_9ACTN|nr:hypothetical protein [Actinomadura rubteroloni]POM26016.1 hypothetical protein BTM25_04000 [Actinomadura rubteroloni]
MNDALIDHARTLDADAAALADRARRLRALAERLRAEDAPSWVFDALHAHITACVIASNDLAEAAARLYSCAVSS